MADWQRVILGVALAGLVSWGGWASFTLANQSRDIAFIQGSLQQIEKQLDRIEK